MTTTTRRPCRWPFGPDPVQDPPTYDWRDFLGDADALIELPGMSEPVYQRQALARLLAATREVYFNALDDWKSRRADDKPRYGRRDDDEGEGWEGAGAYLRAAYGRPEGNPGTGGELGNMFPWPRCTRSTRWWNSGGGSTLVARRSTRNIGARTRTARRVEKAAEHSVEGTRRGDCFYSSPRS